MNIDSDHILDLVNALGHEDMDVRSAALDKLYELGPDILQFLPDHIFNENWLVRFNIIKLIQMFDLWTPEILEALDELSQEEENENIIEKLDEIQNFIGGNPQSIDFFKDNFPDIIHLEAEEFEGKTRRIESFIIFEMIELIKVLSEDEIAINIIPSEKTINGFCIEVKDEQFEEAVDIIKDFFAIDLDDNYPECPACGAEINGEGRCPDCELNLSAEGKLIPDNHPFMMFLEENNLLNS